MSTTPEKIEVNGVTYTRAIPEEEKPVHVEEPYFRDMCGDCGILYCITTEFLHNRIIGPRNLRCPNGHVQTADWKWVRKMNERIRTPWDDFIKMTCGSCGLNYQLTKDYQKLKNGNNSIWHCPSGCQQMYSKQPPPPAPPPPAKTPADIDYEKLIAFHSALGAIASLEPVSFRNKKFLKQAILIAKNTLQIERAKDEAKKDG